MLDTPRLEIVPLAVEARFKPFDLGPEVWNSLMKNDFRLEDGDILVVSSKYAAISEGRIIPAFKCKG